MVENALQPKGFVVTVCLSGVEALELIKSRTHLPDLILLDCVSHALLARLPTIALAGFPVIDHEPYSHVTERTLKCYADDAGDGWV